MTGVVSIVDVRGHIDEEDAASLLEFAAAASTCGPVQIDLDHVDSITPEAAALLLFRKAPGHAFPERISLRASGEPGRQAVLRAYSRRRARPQTA